MMNKCIAILFLLTTPIFVFALDIPPHNDVNIGNSIHYEAGKGSQGGVINVKPSNPKSHFNNVSCNGSSCTGGRPINATVNNGYGDSGKINTQAASSYGKLGGIRGAANKAFPKIAALTWFPVAYDGGHWLGSNIYNLYDCVAYGTQTSCHPDTKGLPIPQGVPAPPETPWTEPKGAYDPNAEVIVVAATGSYPDTGGSPFASYYVKKGDSLSGSGSTSPYTSDNGIVIHSPGGDWYVSTFPATKENIDKYANIAINKVRPNDFQRPFTEQDLYNALMWNLEHMPQEIATAIMNALHDAGFLGAPDSTVFDPASYISPPYTASDTGIAQQDKFTLNQDGSMSHQVIARPDLQGNSQLAPEKQPSTNPTNPTEPEKPTEPEVPEEIVPVPDAVIPEKTIDLNFQPENTFPTNGVCPAPRTVTVMNNTYAFEFTDACDMFAKFRPLVHLFSALMAATMIFMYGKGT